MYKENKGKKSLKSKRQTQVQLVLETCQYPQLVCLIPTTWFKTRAFDDDYDDVKDKKK